MRSFASRSALILAGSGVGFGGSSVLATSVGGGASGSADSAVEVMTSLCASTGTASCGGSVTASVSSGLTSVISGGGGCTASSDGNSTGFASGGAAWLICCSAGASVEDSVITGARSIEICCSPGGAGGVSR
ncbi:hypothetical protein [Methylobacterium sp. WL18]|uniref:hypothetical protein n=1 Tax=Methylobacterium sp. WL18 TaxID=2603897 RepID=UPI00165051A2|nr:hypothetical protein [Methylobacterium sp. WL18]